MKSRLMAVILFLSASFTTNAQVDFSGTWNGILNVAGELRLVLHVTQMPDGSYSGTLDSPDQQVSGIKCDKVEAITDASGNKLTFAINNLRVSYTGTLLNDSTLSGTFTQGAKLPLDLHRSDIPYVAKVKNRPQTPKPPFPYKSEEVVYTCLLYTSPSPRDRQKSRMPS